MNKQLLRAELREKLRSADTSADRCIAARLQQHPLYAAAQRVFLYVGVGKEIDTMPIIQKAVRQGKTVALPKSFGKGEMAFYRYTGVLVEGMYHIPEPIDEELLVPVPDDLMIVPGLAFDKRGYRLGQGAGYYDRYLSAHVCHTIGLCREEFLLEEIPVSWNDLPVEYVITENGTPGGVPI